MMNSLRQIALCTGAIVMMGLMAAPPVSADAVSDFYKSKRITLYVGTTAGGGYDRYARTLARHFGRQIPGKPRMVEEFLRCLCNSSTIRCELRTVVNTIRLSE